MAQVMNKTEEQELAKIGVLAPYRAWLEYYIATGTYAATFAEANFLPAGIDIVEKAALVAAQGANPRNNCVDAASKLRFKFLPDAVGLYIKDPGDKIVRSRLLEHARVEARYDGNQFLNEPAFLLPSGIEIERSVSLTESTTRANFEVHRSGANVGVLPIPKGTVWEADKKLSINFFLEAAARAELAALVGNTPAAGFGLGMVFYGRVFATAGTAVGR